MEWININLIPAKPAARRPSAAATAILLIVLISAAAYAALSAAQQRQQTRNRWLQQAVIQAENEHRARTGQIEAYRRLQQELGQLSTHHTAAAQTLKLLSALHQAPPGTRWQEIRFDNGSGTLQLTLPPGADAWTDGLNRLGIGRFDPLPPQNGTQQITFRLHPIPQAGEQP
ncbi:hypothetical protein V6667_02190 [Neisseria leonii]|uniref:hypothetical protein n=1 Tax=Neisseria leonii TaxID=2995413 RepID=UPI0030D2BD6C